MLTNTNTRDPTTICYSYSYCYCNCDSYIDFNGYGYCYGHSYSDCNRYRNASAESNANGNVHFYPKTLPHSKRYAAAKASANSAAASLTGGEHEGGSRSPQRVGKISPTAPPDICVFGA